MAENIPGVRANEIDRSQPTLRGIDGVPAGVIGTAQQGPALKRSLALSTKSQTNLCLDQ